jgi:hypothetical protein
MVAHAVAVALVVFGASLAILIAGWRAAPLALLAHYLGIALLLATTTRLVAGLALLAVGLGVVAIVAEWGTGDEGRMTEDEEQTLTLALSRSAGEGTGPDAPLSSGAGEGPGVRPYPPRPPRAFDVAVVSLVVIGAIGLAASRPLLGPGDDVVDVAVLTGLLACLLGGPARVAAGLLFIGSAGNALLLLADPGAAPGIVLLFAAAQLALALALVHLRAVERELSDAAEPAA